MIGWQSAGYDGWMQRCTLSLNNLQLGQFIFFAYYTVVGLVPPVSPFLFTLLELYELQLQHLLPHSLVLVAIFVHFCEIFVYMCPLISLSWLFHVLRWSRKDTGLIDAYYFQLRAKGLITYIAPWQVGPLERRLGNCASRCPRPPDAANRGTNKQAQRLGGDPEATEGL
jgi:hypothetical protein